jgi:hypothetical protein
MADDTKLTRRQTARHRQSIRVAALINRLQDCADGKIDMSTAQIKAATVLLGKAMPDLQSIDSTMEFKDQPRNEQEIHAELETAMQALTPQDQAKLQQLLGQVPHDVH